LVSIDEARQATKSSRGIRPGLNGHTLGLMAGQPGVQRPSARIRFST
jgi:hypothetical protein